MKSLAWPRLMEHAGACASTSQQTTQIAYMHTHLGLSLSPWKRWSYTKRRQCRAMVKFLSHECLQTCRVSCPPKDEHKERYVHWGTSDTSMPVFYGLPMHVQE